MPLAEGQLEQATSRRYNTGKARRLKNSILNYFIKGVGPTVVARGYDEVHEFEVDELENKDDPSGLGDFFIGGLLSFQCIR